MCLNSHVILFTKESDSKGFIALMACWNMILVWYGMVGYWYGMGAKYAGITVY